LFLHELLLGLDLLDAILDLGQAALRLLGFGLDRRLAHALGERILVPLALGVSIEGEIGAEVVALATEAVELGLKLLAALVDSQRRVEVAGDPLGSGGPADIVDVFGDKLDIKHDASTYARMVSTRGEKTRQTDQPQTIRDIGGR